MDGTLNMGYALGLATLEDDVDPPSKWNHSGLFMSLNYDIPDSYRWGFFIFD